MNAAIESFSSNCWREDGAATPFSNELNISAQNDSGFTLQPLLPDAATARAGLFGDNPPQGQ